METFVNLAQSNAKSPLGIISLFIVLIYGFASLVLIVTNKTEHAAVSFYPIVWFLVIFPFFVLGAFVYILQKGIAYAPSDFDTNDDFQKFMEARQNAYMAFAAEETKQTLQRVAPDKKLDLLELTRKAKANASQVSIRPSGISQYPIFKFRPKFKGSVLWYDEEADGSENDAVVGLRELGLNVLVADTKEAAEKYLSRGNISAVVSDLNGMEQSDSDVSLLKQWRSNYRDVPVIVYDPPTQIETKADGISLVDQIADGPAQLLTALNKL